MIRFILTKQDYIQRAGGATGTLFRHMKPQYNSLSPLTSISTKMYPKSEHSDSRGLEPKEHGVAVTKHLAPCMAFCEVGVQLLAAHMSIMGSDFSLEYICGPIEQFHTVKRLNDHILSALLLPLCIRLGSGQPGEHCVHMRDPRTHTHRIYKAFLFLFYSKECAQRIQCMLLLCVITSVVHIILQVF